MRFQRFGQAGTSAQAGPSTRQCQPRAQRSGRPARPKNGYFSDVDLKAPLYKPIVGAGSEEPLERSKDRYKSDFIWNTNWQEQMDVKEQEDGAAARTLGTVTADGRGYLSLSSINSLDDIKNDLSEQLKATRKTLLPAQPERIKMRPTDGQKRYSDPPTTGETRRWQRSSSFQKRGAAAVSIARAEAVLQREGLSEQEEYDRMKQETSLWTTGTAAVCFALVYTFYTQEVAASYSIGALGGIAYLRLLHRSVDSLGASSAVAAAAGAMSQPRLLIPAILVLIFNRYNALYADQVGLHLQLLPMLAGFFTYKAGVLGRGAVSLFQELSNKPESP